MAPAADRETGIDLVGDVADLDRLRVVLLRLVRRIRASSPDEITPSQWSTLGTIHHFGKVSVGQIAEHEHVQPPSASKIVSGLEQMGLVERHADPADRRTSLISLSEAGHSALTGMRAAGLGFLAERLAQLDPDDVAALEAALPALERLLDCPGDD